MPSERLDIVEESVGIYERHGASESWKRDHGRTMFCFDFAGLVDFGNEVYDGICRLDNDWRLYVFKSLIAYDPAFERRIGGLYAKWLTTSEGVLELYDKIKRDFISRGFDTAPIEELRSHCREVRGSMVNDTQFFSHDKTFDLADEAVESHRNNETEPLEVS